MGWSKSSSLGGYLVCSEGCEGTRYGARRGKEHVCRTFVHILECQGNMKHSDLFKMYKKIP